MDPGPRNGSLEPVPGFDHRCLAMTILNLARHWQLPILTWPHLSMRLELRLFSHFCPLCPPSCNKEHGWHPDRVDRVSIPHVSPKDDYKPPQLSELQVVYLV